MAHDAFISFAHQDESTARAVCHAVEAKGVRCWFAPRDIRAGMPWAEEITQAIDASRILIVIFSAHSNQSRYVQQEIGIAFDKNIPITQFRIDGTKLSGGMLLHLRGQQWLDASTSPLEVHLERLAHDIIQSFPEIEAAKRREAEEAKQREAEKAKLREIEQAKAREAEQAKQRESEEAKLREAEQAKLLEVEKTERSEAELEAEQAKIRTAMLHEAEQTKQREAREAKIRQIEQSYIREAKQAKIQKAKEANQNATDVTQPINTDEAKQNEAIGIGLWGGGGGLDSPLSEEMKRLRNLAALRLESLEAQQPAAKESERLNDAVAQPFTLQDAQQLMGQAPQKPTTPEVDSNWWVTCLGVLFWAGIFFFAIGRLIYHLFWHQPFWPW